MAARSARLNRESVDRDTESFCEPLTDKKPERKIKPIPKVPRKFYEKLVENKEKAMAALASAQELLDAATFQFPTIDDIFVRAEKNTRDCKKVDVPRLPPTALKFFTLDRYEQDTLDDAIHAINFYEAAVCGDAEHLDDFHLSVTGERMTPDFFSRPRINMANLDVWIRQYIANNILLGYLDDPDDAFRNFCRDKQTMWDFCDPYGSWRENEGEDDDED